MRSLDLGDPVVIPGRGTGYIAKTAQGLFVGEIVMHEGAPHKVTAVESSALLTFPTRLNMWSVVYLVPFNE